MNLTDKNIPIACAECNEIVEGVDNMTQHILELHKGYAPKEAILHARNWADAAYDKNDLWEESQTLYYKGR